MSLMMRNVTGTQNETWYSGIGGGVEAGLRKGPWTAAEDLILAEYVRKHGEGNWNAVQRNSGLNRCGKSCRLRWANHLRPNLKKGAFSPDEERTILELHAKFGNKWSRMAAQLPGRTDNEIKNYWNTRIKRRQRQRLPIYPHKIHPLSAPTTPTTTASASASASTCDSSPTTPTPTPSSAPPHIHFTAASHFHSISPLSSPNHLPFSPSSALSDSFLFHRSPPILGIPARFNRSNAQFSAPLSQPIIPENSNASFQFPTQNLMENLLAQYESQRLAMSLVNSELSSNQINMESEAVPLPPVNRSGLLEDIFADQQALDASKGTQCCLVPRDDKSFLDGFVKMDDPNADNFYLGEAQKEEIIEAESLGQYDWSNLLNEISVTLSDEEWHATGEISDVHPSNLAVEEGCLDLLNLTSFYQDPSGSDIGITPTAGDNLPDIS